MKVALLRRRSVTLEPMRESAHVEYHLPYVFLVNVSVTCSTRNGCIPRLKDTRRILSESTWVAIKYAIVPSITLPDNIR